MTEPAGIQPPPPSAVREHGPRFPDLRPRRTRRAGYAALGITGVATLALAFVPSPFVVEVPGPTFDTLGDTDAGALISISGAETYPTEGELRLLTVAVQGNPERPLTWADVAGAYFDPSDAIIPMEVAFPVQETVEESNQRGQREMENSQLSAVAAALQHQGIPFESEVEIAEVIEGSPADGVLAAGDRILTVNGDVAIDVYSIRASIAREPGASTFEVVRDGQELTIDVTPMQDGEDRIVGIYPANEFTFPFEVDIELPNVGGPSAGMMFALGIIDELTPGAMTAGTHWAGTGTIARDGDVGPIGGIVQKMHGAIEAGATHFLAPVENCDEVAGHVPDGLTVFAVDTLDDAMAAVDAVAAGADTGALPTCEAQQAP